MTDPKTFAKETLDDLDETVIKKAWKMITRKEPDGTNYGYFCLGFQAALIQLIELERIKFDD